MGYMKAEKAMISSKSTQTDSADRVKRHRAMMRARGMRIVSHWVPDTRKPDFLREYRAQLAALAANPEKAGFWRWMDKVRSTEGWV
jgi:hypothetical protein